MKPVNPWTDAEIDSVLRSVPMPPTVAERLGPDRLFDDGTIDRLLVELPVPSGGSGRLHPPFALTGGAASRPAAIPMVRRRAVWGPLRRFGQDAAAVGAALGLTAALLLAGMWFADPPTTAVGRQARTTDRSVPHPPSLAPAADPARPSRPEIAATTPDQPTAGRRREADGGADTPPVARRPPPVRAAPLPVAGHAGSDVVGARRGPFTGMQVVAEGGRPGATRRTVPKQRGFDLAFAMAHGEQPFVDPSVSPALAVDHPPLSVATSSFDRAWPLPPGRERLEAVDGLLTEHLLAALSAPAPVGEKPLVAIHAVRSLRPGRPTYVVEFTVRAPTTGAPQPEPTEATILLDHSAGPDAVPLWIAACRGMAAAAAAVGPAGRMTVVVAEPRPRVVAIRATGAEICHLADELEAELPFGTADLDAAVALADATAARERAVSRLVVVCHADQAERCLGRGREALLSWREAAARGEAAGTQAAFVLLSGVPEGGSDGEESAPGWTLSEPAVVRRRVAETLAGAWPISLCNARLEVRFDPREVATFRLVGHRQTVPESLSIFGQAEGARASTDLYPGEVARVVYEVVPRAAASGRLTGISARLVYRHRSGTDREVHVTEISTEDAGGSLPSARGCELLLAVGLGELAGRSIHAPPGRGAVQSLRELASAWRDRGDMTAVGSRLEALLGDAATGRSGHGR